MRLLPTSGLDWNASVYAHPSQPALESCLLPAAMISTPRRGSHCRQEKAKVCGLKHLGIRGQQPEPEQRGA